MSSVQQKMAVAHRGAKQGLTSFSSAFNRRGDADDVDHGLGCHAAELALTP
jgi:hypothetical protein